MKKVAGKLRLELAQFRSLASFAQFGSDLDEVTVKRIERGKRLNELLKQNLFQPLSFAKQVVILFAGTQGHLDDIKPDHVQDFETGLFAFLDKSHPGIEEAMLKDRDLTDDTKAKLIAAIEEYKSKRAPSEWKVAKK
jgi:F-type H+-transporting ATPase subunit alpha